MNRPYMENQNRESALKNRFPAFPAEGGAAQGGAYER